jgi:lipopolysaccharide biosynthesis glycosyltransferase
VNCERLKALPTTKNWSIAMYFRFVIADYFIDQQDKILYLDADLQRTLRSALQQQIETLQADNNGSCQ